jgi:hypothetical protein
MGDAKEIPQSSPVDEPVNARAFDADGNVRPADGRWLGDRNDDVPTEQLQAEREKQIADGEAAQLERFRKMNAEPEAEPPARRTSGRRNAKTSE